MFFKQNTSFIKGFIILFPATILHVHQVISSQNVLLPASGLHKKENIKLCDTFAAIVFWYNV